ncbi:hypothetical protein N9251_00700 [Gammaproteobacteria bacterium]|nr:hypothetical protein [Gammaproteobacteria bacterium]
MNIANYKNETNMFPITTETFDFIQNQMLLLQKLSKTFGKNYVIEDPTQEQSGVIVINNEICDFLYSTPTNYVKVSVSELPLTFKDQVFGQLLEKRVCRYCSENDNTGLDGIVYELSSIPKVTNFNETIDKRMKLIELLSSELNMSTLKLFKKIEKQQSIGYIKYFVLDKIPQELKHHDMMINLSDHSFYKGVPEGYIPCFPFGYFEAVLEEAHVADEEAKYRKTPQNADSSKSNYQIEEEKWTSLTSYTNCYNIETKKGKVKYFQTDIKGESNPIIVDNQPGLKVDNHYSLQVSKCNDIVVPDLSSTIVCTTQFKEAEINNLSVTNKKESLKKLYIYPFIRCYYV